MYPYSQANVHPCMSAWECGCMHLLICTSNSIFHSAVIGDYTLGGSLSRENACSLQHLFYQMSSQSPLTTLATCRDPQTPGDEDTVVTIPIPQC